MNIPTKDLIYFDNPATSWPKPDSVAEMMNRFLKEIGSNPGRAGHRLAQESGRIVFSAREAVSELFNVPDPLQVVFTQNATHAHNLALKGLLRPGNHVITSSMEHNSMMRPLRALAENGVEFTVVQCAKDGTLDPDDVKRAIKSNTVLIALNHASNVVGTLQPIPDVGQIAREHDLLFMVDAAQTAGSYPIDTQTDCIDLLSFTGHKSLYGPMGTGGLVVGDRVPIDRFEPLMRGGTGSRSEFQMQPEFMPDKFESGTPNAVGLAGLAAGATWVLSQTVEKIRTHEMKLTKYLLDGLKEIPGVVLYGVQDADKQTATLSFNIENADPAEIGLQLDDRYGILCRIGLHCAPAAHETIGSFPSGTIRFGLGAFNRLEEVQLALSAVKELAGEST